MSTKLPAKYSAGWICLTALFLSMNIAMSSFGIPVPGGHLYLCDAVICTAALLLDPLAAFVVGGIGSFLGDFFFYPAPMFVSLVTHGLQAVVISCCVRYLPHHGKKSRLAAALTGLILGSVIMVTGYTLGRAYVYSTPAYAIIKLPYEILQAAVGVVFSLVICLRYHFFTEKGLR